MSLQRATSQRSKGKHPQIADLNPIRESQNRMPLKRRGGGLSRAASGGEALGGVKGQHISIMRTIISSAWRYRQIRAAALSQVRNLSFPALRAATSRRTQNGCLCMYHEGHLQRLVNFFSL